ncbi:ATP-binding cassette domain-containing protein [Paenibacillus sp. FA6]|uniref:ATP-binding cassette domain-containing protein n=1 Tax=Paenibacillus sp. FA6 TaxID=3413029 RepID=UPI003F6567E2
MLVNMLTKRYGNSIILKDISLNFNQGEIVGLIGRNGAGKSTLMKIITQNIQTYDGSVADNHQVGYLIEEPKLFNNKTGLFHLTYFSGIYGNTFKLNEYEMKLVFDYFMRSQEKKGLAPRKLFWKRTAWLFVFGAVHLLYRIPDYSGVSINNYYEEI